MHDPEKWRPTKFHQHNGVLRASRDPEEVAVGSRLTADRLAGAMGRVLSAYARGALLDLGCGNVPFYGVYRGLVSDTTCVDWAGTPHRSRHIDLEHDLTEQLPFDDDTFETILLSDVLEHVPTPADLWAEMARVLAPGGHVLVSVPFMYMLHERPHDYFRYTEFALIRFVGQAGLELVHLEAYGGVVEVLGDIVGKGLAEVPGLGTTAAAAVQSGLGLLGRTKTFRGVSTWSAERFPLGYVLVARKYSDRDQAADGPVTRAGSSSPT